MLLKFLALGWVAIIAIGFIIERTVGVTLLLLTIATVVFAATWIVLRLFVLQDADELVEEEYEEHFQSSMHSI